MYYLFGLEEVGKMLSVLCGFKTIHTLSDPELRRAYNAYIERESIFECRVDWAEPRIIDFYRVEAYAKGFFEQKKDYYVHNSAVTESRIYSGYFDEILCRLDDREPNISALCRLIVKLIVVNHLSEYTNGTTEDTLGVANLNFKDDYDETDFVELVFHQLTHMLLFFDDTTRSHMRSHDKDVKITTTVSFALGGSDFPAYLAFHSYIVAIEMLLFRVATATLTVTPKYHGPTSRIIRLIRAFWSSLSENMALFQPRGREILVASNEAFCHFEREHGRFFVSEV
jgi:hypothetical protein